jgi:flavin reductase (DIM6/NTAB) family NADH-FMN oxidoreductase RutF
VQEEEVALLVPDTPPVVTTVSDVRTFWQAVGLKAVGTAVIAAEADEGPRGFLALSATHLSADPPTMMITVDSRTSALGTLLSAGHFAINFLAVGQEEIAAPFTGKGVLQGADRFKTATWHKLVTGAPCLDGASGVIDCRIVETIERYGSVIVIGLVEGFAATPGTRPLISHGGRYL